eukprot:s8504_g1.t1
MSEVVKKFLSFQAWAGIQADIEHIPGYRNALADELSRLDPGVPAPLAGADRLHPPLRWLLSQRPWLEPSTASWPAPFAAILATGVSLDRRGFIRLSAEDRPGVCSPVSENAISSPRDIPVASADSSPALRESEIGYPVRTASCASRDIPVASADSSPALRESEIGYPVRTASCASCELLRAEITALRNELLLARSSEFHAIWDALHALQARVSEVSPSLDPEHFSLVFTAIHESAGARLLRDPILMVRCLRMDVPFALAAGDR